jgi:uncharacterized membrane protein YdbT with pleckstrin-like domain
MGYIERNLLQGEQVEYRAKLHWLLFVTPVLFFILGPIFLVVGSGDGFKVLATIFFGFGALLFAIRYIKYATSEFAVTNKRVLIKMGLISRHTLELVLGKVETIGVDQSISGRILNFGTITVTGTGGTKEPFKNIANPLEFRKQVQSRLSG